MVPKCRKCDQPVPVTAPAWADPRAVMAQSGWTFTRHDYTLVPGDTTLQILRADPKRVACGFSCAAGGDMFVAPMSEPRYGGWRVGSGIAEPVRWFTLFDFGPLVTSEWYVLTAASHITSYEVYRLQ